MTFDKQMQADKTRVALTSVLAAIFLTLGKLVVGISTGSLGILSEALHSALDLGAALITYIAVRLSDKPADEDHSYGHGKIENISSLFQIGLLMATCFFIIKAAIGRIISQDAHVDVTVWSFAVLIISVAVDFGRSRALSRMAKAYRSQALEADALHFSTDIWSSLVVVIGLAFTYFGMRNGDSLAAIGVAVFVLMVSARLLKRTIGALTDSIPKDIEEKVKALMKTLDRVHSYRHLRVRQSGSKIFVDMYVHIKRTVPFELAHDVTDEVESKISEIVKNADILIHMEPYETDDESLLDKIRMIVTEEGLMCHNVQVQKVNGSFYADFHLECEGLTSFAEAHRASARVEEKILQKILPIKKVKIHIEDAGHTMIEAEDITSLSQPMLEKIKLLAALDPHIRESLDLTLIRIKGQKKLMMNCVIDPNLSLDEVHTITTNLENAIYQNWPEVHQVVIHPEILEDHA
jgi:cation diffusion facilitator family transporter